MWKNTETTYKNDRNFNLYLKCLHIRKTLRNNNLNLEYFKIVMM